MSDDDEKDIEGDILEAPTNSEIYTNTERVIPTGKEKKSGRTKKKADEKTVKEEMPWSNMYFEEIKCPCGGYLDPDLGQCSECGREYGFGAAEIDITFDKSAIATGFDINIEDVPELARRNVSSIAKFVEYHACKYYGKEVKFIVSEDQQANPDIVADVPDY
ncbi:MAG: hypothetical protein ACFFB0_20080 [Promethearchaeota archaeon]